MKGLNLSTRLSVSLSLIVLLFAIAVVGLINLHDRSTSLLARVANERKQTRGTLEIGQRAAEQAVTSMQGWLLNRRTPVVARPPAWPAEAATFKQQLAELRQRWSQGPEADARATQAASYLLEQYALLEQLHRSAVQTVPGPQALANDTAYNAAVALMAARLEPTYREVQRTVRELVQQRDAVAEQAAEEAEQAGKTYRLAAVVGFLTVSFIIILIGRFLVQSLIRPMIEIRTVSTQLAAGEIPAGELEAREDELGEVAEALNQITESLKTNIEVANRIGQGKFAVTEEFLEQDDAMSEALLQMHERLQLLAEREARRNWAIAGFARFGEVLRRTTDLNVLADDIISNLARYVKANLGAIFLLNDDNPTDPKLELVASYAYNKRKFLHREFAIGEGLVGQAAMELETIHITQIPENYVILASGLGEAPPNSLLIVPLVSSENLFGVIELASFNRFNEDEVTFVRQLGENIAAVVSNMKSNEKTLKLLAESRRLSEELQAKQSDLQSSNQTMQLTQDQLQQSNSQLEQQMRKLNQTALELSQSEKRFYTLLENASEIITIFEKSGLVRYQSPSMERILGYRPEDVPDFFRYVFLEDVPKVRAFLQELAETPNHHSVVEYRYRKKDGTIINLASQGRNLLTDPSIGGLVVNTRDITERIRADVNAQRRMQFQSLSENSPDLITRYDIEGRYLYINPTIKRYTSRDPDFYIGKMLQEVGLSPDEVKFWHGAIDYVQQTQKKRSAEVTMPSILGDRIMQVEIIPEPSVDDGIPTVLVVAHDITEIKQIERTTLEQNQKLQLANQEVMRQKAEIEEKNQDITESIRYAMRIQESILPNSHLMEQALGEMMIIFKPRDIVSGDFYWYLKKDDKIFLATVDCTGHGVPGAFMSLIGSTLLNQIVNEMGITEPARILTNLNTRVRQALKQTDADGKDLSAKDGMDLALVRIDLKGRTVQFAGAYRPMYWWHQYEIHEIKGEKYGIGGMELEPGEVRHFSNHELRIEAGDAIYLFSDGFADQFGGPEGKKFTTKRFRDILLRNQHRSMKEQQRILERHFEEWRGNQQQVDDIVVLGIRFS